jgi:hypothetical protein
LQRRGWRSRLAALLSATFLAGFLVAVDTTGASAATVDTAKWYVLVNRNSGKALEVQGASTADGGKAVQYADWGGANQQWQLVPVSDSGSGGTGSLPSTFRWSSSGALAGPKSDSTHTVEGIKDFSVVRHNDKWLVYATTASKTAGWGLEMFSFSDWSQAASATPTYLDRTSRSPAVTTSPSRAPHGPRTSATARWSGRATTRP